MGICTSCDANSVATAKLILQDGRLQEYSYPVKVSYILQTTDPTCFICNSDDMEFDDVVNAVRDDDELQPGQLYFALPRSKLRRPLQPEEMAALAVKASAALMRKSSTGGGGGGRESKCRKCCKCRRGTPLPSRKVVDGGGARVEDGGDEERRRMRRSGSSLRTIME